MQEPYRVESLPPLIPIGIQTEEGVCAVDIDCSAWLEAWPDMICSAVHTRPGETDAYPVVTEMVGTVLRWFVSLVDTEIPGQGVIEVIGLAPGRRKLSGRTCTHVEETSASTSGEAPEAIRPFVDQVLAAAARAEQAAKDAEEHKLDGKDGVSPTITVESVPGGALIKMTDVNGTTSVTLTEGRDGKDGHTPVKGVDYFDGKDGYTPVKGVDYFDGKNGVSPTVSANKSGSVTKLTITDADGTETAEIHDGEDGHTPVKGVDYFDGKDGAPGVGIKDVTWTASSEDGGVNQLKIIRSDDTADTFFVRNGSKGGKGDAGVSVTHEWDGSTLKVTSASGTSSADLKGGKGEKGDPGLAWAGDWDENTGYSSGSIVRYNGSLYVAETGNALVPDGIAPSDDPDSWGLLMPAATGVANVYTKTVALGSGEANIIAVELTDGTVKTFQVRNGEKGDRGPEGPQGGAGQRGSRILKVTTATTSYTTTVGGFQPSYRMPLATVLAEAGSEDVRVGDVIWRSYYKYPVGYVDESYVYMGAYVNFRGATGAAGKTPVAGTDYYTAAEKTAMITDVTAGLAKITLVGTDEDDVQHTWTLHGAAN